MSELFSRHSGFEGATVGKASVMAMCGQRSGGVVQVCIIATILFIIYPTQKYNPNKLCIDPYLLALSKYFKWQVE